MGNLADLLYSIVSSYIYTHSLVVMEHKDHFFVYISILDLQKVFHSIKDVIITVRMVTTELHLYLREEVVI